PWCATFSSGEGIGERGKRHQKTIFCNGRPTAKGKFAHFIMHYALRIMHLITHYALRIKNYELNIEE
ncbi:MAG: hypothetical protein II629_01795, partial [Ruminococcus sp.]|nr:hypothetical protein [Ruminococcus sp.]